MCFELFFPLSRTPSHPALLNLVSVSMSPAQRGFHFYRLPINIYQMDEWSLHLFMDVLVCPCPHLLENENKDSHPLILPISLAWRLTITFPGLLGNNRIQKKGSFSFLLYHRAKGKIYPGGRIQMRSASKHGLKKYTNDMTASRIISQEACLEMADITAPFQEQLSRDTKKPPISTLWLGGLPLPT